MAKPVSTQIAKKRYRLQAMNTNITIETFYYICKSIIFKTLKIKLLFKLSKVHQMLNSTCLNMKVANTEQ